MLGSLNVFSKSNYICFLDKYDPVNMILYICFLIIIKDNLLGGLNNVSG